MTSTAISNWIAEYYDQNTQNPQLLYRRVIYWGVIIISTLIIALTVRMVHIVQRSIEVNIDHLLLDYSEYRDNFVVDGRDVYAHGKITTYDEVNELVELISKLPLVRGVTDKLEIEPRPSPYLGVFGTQDEIYIHGEIPGDVLEYIIETIETTFPFRKITDTVRIDDRLSKPVWIHGFPHGLKQLKPLAAFELYAWRIQLQLNGVVDDLNQARQIGYALPVNMRRSIRLDNRLREKSDQDQAQLILVADWSGTRLKGILPDIKTSNLLESATRQAFGQRKIDTELNFIPQLKAAWLPDLVKLMPHLTGIRSLRIQNDGNGLSLWGSVNNPYQMGMLVKQRNKLKRSELINLHVNVEPAGYPATISLFTDINSIYLRGEVPTLFVKNKIEIETRKLLGKSEIINEIKVKPRIAESDWIKRWSELLGLLPTGISGLTVGDNSILITGKIDHPDKNESINQRIKALLPYAQINNWISIVTPSG